MPQWFLHLAIGFAVALPHARIVPGVVESSVGVRVERGAVATTYHYEVRNHSSGVVRVFSVGLGMALDEDVSDAPDGGGEFRVMPLGTPTDWMTASDGRISPAGAVTPPHWYAELKRVEETSGLFISFYADSNQHGIPPGRTLAGFQLIVPDRGDAAYACGHFTLIPDGQPNVVGRLTLLRGAPCPPPAESRP